MTKFQRDFLNHIAQVIFDKNGRNIFALDLRNTPSITDYIIITEGTVDRHVKALAKNVIEAAFEWGIEPYMIEGLSEGDWIVVDFADIVVHFFIPEVREKYRLEELWEDAEIVDLVIKIPDRNNYG